MTQAVVDVVAVILLVVGIGLGLGNWWLGFAALAAVHLLMMR